MVKITPRQLPGEWSAGYALDLHTVSSTLVGYNEWGHEVFDTRRSEMGELLYRLKYQSDRAAIRIIVETVVEFVRSKSWEIDLVVPVPPSSQRDFQPVLALAEAVAWALGAGYCDDCVVKVRETPQLKGIFDRSQRVNLLKDAFAVSKNALAAKNVLLFDDLYRSGATLQAISSALITHAAPKRLCVLTLTMTRKKR